jgi:hypothetical protein
LTLELILKSKNDSKTKDNSLAQEMDNPMALDFLQANIIITHTGKELKLNQSILFPNVSFDYYEIAGLKLVQTPLVEQMLNNKCDDTLGSGLVTLDRDKRVLAINTID